MFWAVYSEFWYFVFLSVLFCGFVAFCVGVFGFDLVLRCFVGGL